MEDETRITNVIVNQIAPGDSKVGIEIEVLFVSHQKYFRARYGPSMFQERYKMLKD